MIKDTLEVKSTGQGQDIELLPKKKPSSAQAKEGTSLETNIDEESKEDEPSRGAKTFSPTCSMENATESAVENASTPTPIIAKPRLFAMLFFLLLILCVFVGIVAVILVLLHKYAKMEALVVKENNKTVLMLEDSPAI